MRIGNLVITAAVVVGLSAPALAQQGSVQPAQTPSNPVVTNTYDDAHNWMASGFLGTNFGSSRNGDNAGLLGLERFDSGTTSANFGGQIGYLGRGVIGGEFLAEFSPRSAASTTSCSSAHQT
jgi:hypothetical protein